MVGMCVAYNQQGAWAESRDPFISIIDLEKQKLVEQKVLDLSNVIVNGIIWNESASIAIINDELVMAGDKWRDVIMEKIEKDRVISRSQDKSYTLSIDNTPDAQKEQETVKTSGLSLPQEEAPGEGMPPSGGGE